MKCEWIHLDGVPCESDAAIGLVYEGTYLDESCHYVCGGHAAYWFEHSTFPITFCGLS